jgi:hypothetical protein
MTRPHNRWEQMEWATRIATALVRAILEVLKIKSQW